MDKVLDPAGLVGVATELGKVFATRATQHDRDASFPIDDFEDMREAGLLGIMVPKEHGGFGADFLTYTRVLEQISKGHAATALTFNMHNIVMGGVAELDLSEVPGRHGDRMRSFAEWLFEEAIEHKRVFASATTEPGVGAKYSQLRTTYDRTEDGYILNGVKSFVSMVGFADYVVVAARPTEESTGSVPRLSYFCVARDTEGTSIEEVWDVLGMRATTSNTLYLNDVFVPKDRLFMGSEGMAFYKLLNQPHWQVGGYNGAYLGISTAILEFTTDYLMKKSIAGTDKTAADDPVIQYQIGEMAIKLAATRAMTFEAARLVTEQPGSHDANVAIHQAKYMVGEVAPELASMAIRVCGGSTISKRMPLERLYRDARCGGLMPAKSDDCLRYVGKAAMGTDVTKVEESYW